MIRPNLNNIRTVPFPDGYGIRTFQPGEGGLWEDIQRDAEPFLTIDSGLFAREFGHDMPATAIRCCFLTDPGGDAVGTISAWYGQYRDQNCGRIHWVAVRPAYQRRGLARAWLSDALRRLAKWHSQALLDTSTERLGAIRLYLEAGFVPDLDYPGAQDAWREVAENDGFGHLRALVSAARKRI